VRGHRGGGQGVELGKSPAPGSQVVAGLQGAPQGERARAVHRMPGGPAHDGVPEREERCHQPQRGHHREQQAERPPIMPWPRVPALRVEQP
jgi:hypothetical protein